MASWKLVSSFIWKIFLSPSNSFVDISFDTYMPIFKFPAPANSSANSDKQTNKQIIEF